MGAKDLGAAAEDIGLTGRDSGSDFDDSEVNLDGTVRGSWNAAGEDKVWMRPPELPQAQDGGSPGKDWSNFAQRHYARRAPYATPYDKILPPEAPPHIAGLLSRA